MQQYSHPWLHRLVQDQYLTQIAVDISLIFGLKFGYRFVPDTNGPLGALEEKVVCDRKK